MTTRVDGEVYCITGIDTDIGKTVATGLIAKGLHESGVKVITQKAVQTGCVELSEDIEKHRQIMGCSLFWEDKEGLTCSYLFSTPCSPHLAARIEGDEIDVAKITDATKQLQSRFDVVLLEGAGGLFVPVSEEYTLLDYFVELAHPIILVTSSRLGSINHTLASLEALSNRKLSLAAVIYNCHENSAPHITKDSREIIALYLRKYGFSCPLIDMRSEEHYKEIGSCKLFITACGR